MRAPTHFLIAMNAAFLCQPPSVLHVGVMALGGLAPDVIDRFVCPDRRVHGERAYLDQHRRITHVLGFYVVGVVMIGLMVALARAADGATLEFKASLVLMFVAGGLTHVLADMLTPMGVPLWRYKYPAPRWRGASILPNQNSREGILLEVFIALAMLVLAKELGARYAAMFVREIFGR